MARPKVLIFAPADKASHARLEAAGCELALGAASWSTPQGNSESELAGMAANADALAGTSIRSSRISREVLRASPRLRIVAKYTVGVDDVDVKAATDMGILVTHAPTEANWGAVAENTLATMLLLLKKLVQRDRAVRDGGWRNPAMQGAYVGAREDGYAGITIGIIGLGRIGGRFAQLLRPWRARVLAHDPYIASQRFVEHGVESVDLPTLLAQSDVVSIHALLTDETRHMIGRAQLRLMKPTAYLQNNARGGIIDEAALIEALREGRIAGTALDVFEREPLPADSPLFALGDRVLLSPHMAASCHRAGLHQGYEWATDDVLTALRGAVPAHVFNSEAIAAWRARFEGRNLL